MASRKVSGVVSEELHGRVVAEAEARGVTPDWFVSKLVAEGMERLAPADEFRLTMTADLEAALCAPILPGGPDPGRELCPGSDVAA